jgi:hypothetical protein
MAGTMKSYWELQNINTAGKSSMDTGSRCGLLIAEKRGKPDRAIARTYQLLWKREATDLVLKQERQTKKKRTIS